MTLESVASKPAVSAIEKANDWLDSMGLSLPLDFDANNVIVVAALSLGLWVAGWFFGQWLAPKLNHIIDARAGDPDKTRSKLVRSILQFGLISLFELILFNIWGWDRLSVVVVGVVLAIAATMFINRAARLLRLPKMGAVLLSVVVFVLIISRLLGGVQPVYDALDQIGFNAGETRISLLTVVIFTITVLLLFAAVRVAHRVLDHVIEGSSKLDQSQKVLTNKLATMAVVALAFFVGIDMLGIDLTALAVFSGAFGLAIGFGFQKTFGNLISGIILLMDRSIKPGDVIAVGDSFGWVNKIGIRAVSIVTRDGKEHLIPNENLMTNEVENWSFSSKNVRVRVPVGISYNADMDVVEKLMLDAAMESPRVLKKPKPNVWMKEYGDNSVNFEILCWINDPEEGVGNVRSDVLKRLWKLLKSNEIEIPFPQRDLHLRSVDAAIVEAIAEKLAAKS